MRTFLERIQPMSNVHLPFVSMYQRMTDFVHTLAYASAIRNSVTGLYHKLFERALDIHTGEMHVKGMTSQVMLPGSHWRPSVMYQCIE